MMAIEMMSGLSSFRAPARQKDSGDGSSDNLPRIRFPNYSLRSVRNRSQTDASSPGSTIDNDTLTEEVRCTMHRNGHRVRRDLHVMSRYILVRWMSWVVRSNQRVRRIKVGP